MCAHMCCVGTVRMSLVCVCVCVLNSSSLQPERSESMISKCIHVASHTYSMGTILSYDRLSCHHCDDNYANRVVPSSFLIQSALRVVCECGPCGVHIVYVDGKCKCVRCTRCPAMFSYSNDTNTRSMTNEFATSHLKTCDIETWSYIPSCNATADSLHITLIFVNMFRTCSKYLSVLNRTVMAKS